MYTNIYGWYPSWIQKTKTGCQKLNPDPETGRKELNPEYKKQQPKLTIKGYNKYIFSQFRKTILFWTFFSNFLCSNKTHKLKYSSQGKYRQASGGDRGCRRAATNWSLLKVSQTFTKLWVICSIFFYFNV